MKLTNEDRGGLVGAFIVEEGDEILSITAAGQVVRSPINENFRATGRDSMGVKFVTTKSGDSVAVVARSVEAKVVEEATGAADEESTDVVDDATIDAHDAGSEAEDSAEVEVEETPDENTEE